MNQSSRSYDFLWMSIALMPLIVISMMFAIPPQDYWWLLRVGQDTLQSGSVPVVDLISSSQYGAPIIYQPWLSGVIFYLLNLAGGVSLVFLFRGIVIGITYGLIWTMVRREISPQFSTVLVIVLGLASSGNWSMRSQLLVYPLFTLCLWSLFHWQKGNNKFLWVVPLCVLLWSNMHGSFILPFVLAGSALIFGQGDKKRLSITLVIMLAATLINPRGPGAWGYLNFMLNSPSDHLYSPEWKPPSNLGWQMNIFFAWVILIAPLAAFSPRKFSRMEWVWFIGFAWLAFSGLRYVIWFLMIAAILTASLLSSWKKEEGSQGGIPAFNIGIGIFILSLTLIFLPGVRSKFVGDSIPVYERATSPADATEWLKDHPALCENLWADYTFGGYLSFNLPSCHPWMDSRFNAFPPEQWAEYLKVNEGNGWQEMFDRENFNSLMLSKVLQPKLVEQVSASDMWCKQYQDDYAIIFSRCEGTE